MCAHMESFVVELQPFEKQINNARVHSPDLKAGLCSSSRTTGSWSLLKCNVSILSEDATCSSHCETSWDLEKPRFSPVEASCQKDARLICEQDYKIWLSPLCCCSYDLTATPQSEAQHHPLRVTFTAEWNLTVIKSSSSRFNVLQPCSLRSLVAFSSE